MSLTLLPWSWSLPCMFLYWAQRQWYREWPPAWSQALRGSFLGQRLWWTPRQSWRWWCISLEQPPLLSRKTISPWLLPGRTSKFAQQSSLSTYNLASFSEQHSLSKNISFGATFQMCWGFLSLSTIPFTTTMVQNTLVSLLSVKVSYWVSCLCPRLPSASQDIVRPCHSSAQKYQSVAPSHAGEGGALAVSCNVTYSLTYFPPKLPTILSLSHTAFFPILEHAGSTLPIRLSCACCAWLASPL